MAVHNGFINHSQLQALVSSPLPSTDTQEMIDGVVCLAVSDMSLLQAHCSAYSQIYLALNEALKR